MRSLQYSLVINSFLTIPEDIGGDLDKTYDKKPLEYLFEKDKHNSQCPLVPLYRLKIHNFVKKSVKYVYIFIFYGPGDH